MRQTFVSVLFVASVLAGLTNPVESTGFAREVIVLGFIVLFEVTCHALGRNVRLKTNWTPFNQKYTALRNIERSKGCFSIVYNLRCGHRVFTLVLSKRTLNFEN